MSVRYFNLIANLWMKLHLLDVHGGMCPSLIALKNDFLCRNVMKVTQRLILMVRRYTRCMQSNDLSNLAPDLSPLCAACMKRDRKAFTNVVGSVAQKQSLLQLDR